MRPRTAAAIRTLLRIDSTVTPSERHAVIAAMMGEKKIDPTLEMSIAEASEVLQLARNTLWRWCATGKVAAIRRGKKYYLPPSEIKRLRKEGADA